MGRGAHSTCPDDELTLLELLEQTGKYIIRHDRLPSHTGAAAVRPKRSSHSRRGRNAPAGEDKDSLKLQFEVIPRFVPAEAILDADSSGHVNATQARQRTDGATGMGGPEPDAGSRLVQVIVDSVGEDIIAPGPASFATGSRRDLSQANLEDGATRQSGPKRRRQGQDARPEAPVGIPTPINAPIAACAAIFDVVQDEPVDDRSADWQQFPSGIGLPEIDRVAEEPSEQDPYAHLSLSTLNEILEKRLRQRLVPEFQPKQGSSKAAAVKQFQQDFLKNRVDHFRAVLKQTSLLTSAHAEIAESLTNLGDLQDLPATAQTTLKEDRPALLALKKLCKKAPQFAEQQVEFAAVMKEFHDATTQHEAAEQVDRQLFTRQEMEARMKDAADEREVQVRDDFAARQALAPEPADQEMLPLPPDLMAEHSTNDSQRDAAIQAIAHTLAPAHRLTEKSANIEEVLFDSYGENGKVGGKYWARLKALVLKMCPESYDAILESTFGTHGNHASAADGSSATLTGHSAADAVDLQHLDALQSEQAAADSIRGKLWEGTVPPLHFATGVAN
eukprot:jgi/Ulvmu1/245/UM001_0249.1